LIGYLCELSVQSGEDERTENYIDDFRSDYVRFNSKRKCYVGIVAFSLRYSVFQKTRIIRKGLDEAFTNVEQTLDNLVLFFREFHFRVLYRYHLSKCKTMIFLRGAAMYIWFSKADFQQKWQQRSKATLFLGGVALLLSLPAVPTAGAQAGQFQTATRKIRLSAPPQYPELARRMNIQGVARVLLTVAPDGKVSDVKELGGNPVLVSSLVQAVKKWRYEAADQESSIEVRFEFK